MNDYLASLGLALRAKLVSWGDVSCRETIMSGKAKLILISCDCGASLLRSIEKASFGKDIERVTLPETKDELGAALGKKACSVVTVNDQGFAALIMSKTRF